MAGCKDGDIYPIDEDHSNIVKFSEGSEYYGTIVSMLHRLSGALSVFPIDVFTDSKTPLPTTASICSPLEDAARPKTPKSDKLRNNEDENRFAVDCCTCERCDLHHPLSNIELEGIQYRPAEPLVDLIKSLFGGRTSRSF